MPISAIGSVPSAVSSSVARSNPSQATLELLEQCDVDYAQGYEIGRPAPIDTIFNNDESSIKSA